jgi:hypothetical protein
LMVSIMSFLNTTKYPTSLQYLLMTIGPALVFLALTEAVKNRVSETVLAFGRVSLFFYIVHIYLIHSLALAGLVITGRSWTEWIITAEDFLSQTPSDAGFPLYVVFVVWALVVAAMYPPSKWYRVYKKAHPERWLLRYV